MAIYCVTTNSMRGLFVTFVVCRYACALSIRLLINVPFRKPGRAHVILGECIASAAEQLGGAFLKVGQILSTRVDLLPTETIAALSRLRDNVRPVKFREIEHLLAPLRCSNRSISIADIDCKPVASATIAQVFVGTDQSSGKPVAVKVRRPHISRLLRTDIMYIRCVSKLVARLPWFSRVPVREATEEICSALFQQADFRNEAQMLERFHRLFRSNPDVRVPAPIPSLCNGDVIVMEYLAEYRPIQSFRHELAIAKTAVQNGLRALYKMIFSEGLIHCDLHSGNILCKDDGTIALLDFGFVSEMTCQARLAFAEFFLSIALRDGKAAAKVIRESALRVSGGFDHAAFERDIADLIAQISGKRAAEFQIAGFVRRMFWIQAKHGVYGSPQFTLPILSLLTYEGLIKEVYPEIDFQEEAVPFVIEALRVASE